MPEDRLPARVHLGCGCNGRLQIVFDEVQECVRAAGGPLDPGVAAAGRGHVVHALRAGVPALGIADSDNHRIIARLALQTAVVRSEEHTSELQSLLRLSYAV